MKDFKQNQANYEATAAIPETHQLQKTKLLILHGTGDDNVHVLNSMWLSHRLQRASLPTGDPYVNPAYYRLQFIPDDDHSMDNTINARQMVYQMLVRWLVDSFAEVDRNRLTLSDLLRSFGNQTNGSALLNTASQRCFAEGILCG